MSEVVSPVLTVKELGHYLKLSKKTLYTWVADGRIPEAAILKIGRSLRFRRAVIDRWLENPAVGDIA